ncbi:MAG: DUF4234 domain-containing protein [Thiothrix litoralis]|uniref:DUF4234 domain-containing protein n=1 Tax=Thiothrix litoralis TaxID=2891210 RepID=UPI003C74F304
MPTITDLKDKIDTKTINLLLLNIATMGIYQILWLYKTHRIIDSINDLPESYRKQQILSGKMESVSIS